MKPYLIEMTARKIVVAWAESVDEALAIANDDHFSEFSSGWDPMDSNCHGEITEEMANDEVRAGALESRP